MPTLPTALVPVRTGPIAKRRLAHAVGARDRGSLVIELFEHVTDVLVAAGLRVVVLAPVGFDAGDLEVWPDPAVGLNAIIDAGIDRAGVPVVVVHADLPSIGVQDVHVLLETPGDVVIARARDGGTNALLMRSRIRSAFGPRSALRHARQARSAGLRACVIDREGLALDVDDVASLTSSSRPSSSREPSSQRPSSFR